MNDPICPDCGEEMTYSYVTMTFTCFNCIALEEAAFLAEYDLLEDDEDETENLEPDSFWQGFIDAHNPLNEQ